MPQTALITGASRGLGEAFAEGLAARGFDLILTARSREQLDELANRLRGRRGTRVTVLPADLGDPADRARFLAELSGHQVDLLLNNAGFGEIDEVVAADPARQSGMIELNCQALVELTTALLPAMLQRGRGTVVNVASTAAFQPVPSMAVYAATKSFVLSYSQALHAEVKGRGVRVLAVCPGPTETAFFDVAGRSEVAKGVRRTPQDVVKTTFDGLDQGKAVVIDGLVNRTGAWLGQYLPKPIVMRLARKLMDG